MLEVGTKVTVHPEKGDKVADCIGTITKVCDDCTYEVKFDNGEEGDQYTDSDFMKVGDPPSAKAEPVEDSKFDDKETPKPKPVKTKEDLEREFDDKRKAQVDSDNAVAAKVEETKQEKLANTPLTEEERAFIAKIRPLMNKGKHGPSAAAITRYSKLLAREDV